MKIVQMLAHSIEEHDQVRLLHSLGHDVFSIGAYINPAVSLDPEKRPALPDVPAHPDLKAIVDALGQPHPDEPLHIPPPKWAQNGDCADGHPDPLDAAKRCLPDAIVDWADVIICHHLEHQWIIPQWDRLRHKRVVWRTVGQSAEPNERMMAPLRADGMQIVRYSPQERNIPGYCGEDALIRFYKDPDEWRDWTGEQALVTNVSQDMAGRDPFTNWRFWEATTRGLPRMPAGPQSERIGGVGTLSMPEMHDLLRSARAYLYTGTQPASYTLGLIEAMMTGTPVVSIGPGWMRMLPYSGLLFEGHLIAPMSSDRPATAREYLERLLADHDHAREISSIGRATALDLFGMAKIASEWQSFLG